MTLRQKTLQLIYPLFVFYKRIKAKPKTLYNKDLVKPLVSFYRLSAVMNSGNSFSFENLKGKKVLLVNTASDCGYTGQYKELQQLQEQFPTQLQIIGFPSNDFKEQEKKNDEAIAEFCLVNYGVKFPLAKKSHVRKTKEINDVFKWLTSRGINGWNEQQPRWNFSKYLVDEDGILTHYFDPAVSPLSQNVVKAILQHARL